MKAGLLTVTAALLVSLAPLRPVDALSPDLSGYLEFRGFEFYDIASGPSWGSSLRLRPSLKTACGHGTLHLTGDFNYFTASLRKQAGNKCDNQLARAFLEIPGSSWDLRLGRQSVHWGSAMIWNPTDPFPQVFLADSWAQRDGRDAVRLDHPMGEDSSCTLLVSFDDSTWRVERCVGRYSTLVGTTDLVLTASYGPDDHQSMAGFDLRGESTVGWWIEAAWRDNGDKASSRQSVIGIDYSFPAFGGLEVALQHVTDTSGGSHPYRYDYASKARGERATLGRNYLSLHISPTSDPDVAATISVIHNLVDRSTLLVPQVTWRLSQNSEIITGADIGCNHSGEFRQSASLDPFGTVPEQVLYVWYRRYF